MPLPSVATPQWSTGAAAPASASPPSVSSSAASSSSPPPPDVHLSIRRSDALLDVARALASETELDRIVSIIVSQVPELLDSDRCTLYFRRQRDRRAHRHEGGEQRTQQEPRELGVRAVQRARAALPARTE